ncbi:MULTISPECIES: CcoQ/FixQ family Cbb3-type cytochrome c oxidase assembly chaperone [unclassified Neisseria]|uniref:cbb3-type cytochrome oxidase subunit 3 n=1 Tax=unclassified Neisseria TaxID=2623750 RepID=UPI002666B94C|nr:MULTISPECIES: CcoQ/FixQ family Cbb3-type cytochrome c oxidase assembly chaperone [unclassified Neisseria]MDO1509568.1 CcoQ/FixQ family Cbb3-type cytochrome c oxidase assembly chaperone [Neisseria sp. MVDL19-042950]MDO1515660.1 CcoQ/FixQ family Cbb3-type cytochrome c oxidase assembly chaperone [Neisseria sp. MVDL18-041461]MDO1564085.1 CcoQ/FixQ family Cbb3-type cytochrome c oxidase assembly chaperone [Neisseria sp. MVDL20-010259]
MDINWARSLFTIWVFVSFLLVLYIVLNKRNKQNYNDAANSIMEDNDTPDDESGR